MCSEDVMQIDLLPGLPQNGGYEDIITATDVFSRYAFAYPVTSSTAVNTAKVIIDNTKRHAYLTNDNRQKLCFCPKCDTRNS